ncbi:SpoIIE family protein phosphatase [Streptomyces sp. NPDC059009]|uniref:SpoIIE family protein phosphatase n=1 Tax=Streptomyces sp. NPDC059009 TaxID=3346694 RepID=UPI00367AD877
MELDSSSPRPLLSVAPETVLAAAGAAAAAAPLGREYRILRQIVEGTQAGVAVLDTRLRYLYVNPRMARMNGLPAAAHLGRTLADVVPDVHRPEEALRAVLRDGRPRELVGSGRTRAMSTYEHRVWRSTYHRLCGPDGAVVGVVGIGLEVSQPRRYLRNLERAHLRMTRLHTAEARIGTTLDTDTTCQELADFVVPGLATGATVELVVEDVPGRPCRVPAGVTRLRRAAVSAQEGFREKLRPLIYGGDDGAGGEYTDHGPDSPVRRCLEGGRPLLRNLSMTGPVPGPDKERAARYRAAGVHSVLVVPLATGERTIGTLAMVRLWPAPAFTRDDTAVAEELAERASRALERSLQFAREHTMALELQRALLSEPSVPHPNLETASRYLPADDSAVVGGDWFDSLALPQGRNLLVIGDVMGHGVEAAVAMSHYRSMLRALAATGLPPHQVLAQADHMVAASGFDRVATCLLALGDSAAGTMTYANAGHLPPLRLTPQGQAELLPIVAGPPLGTGLGGYGSVVRPALPGGTLLLYTDGLVERRGEDIDSSLARLTRLRLGAGDGLEQILDDVLAQLTDGRAHDDIALLAARKRATPAG